MKKSLWIIILAVIILLAAGAYLYYDRQALPFFHANTTATGTIVGSDRDAHGCIPSAGYSWCEAKQKCLRPWEEACTAAISKPVITYFCQEGILKAVYGSSSVELTLKDGSMMTLPQTISGSGIRYEEGSTTLVGKGDNAFLTQKGSTTYTNCVDGSQSSNQNINTYTDAGKTFSFSYPDQFVLSGGEIGFGQDWSYDTPDLGLLLAVVNIPRSILPGTNFGEAKFSVGTSVDPNALKNCLTSDFARPGSATEVSLNGQQFTKIIFTDVGAGNYYDVTSYRTIYNNQCYVVEEMIHSSNIENYSPDQGIKQFDRTKVAPILESMAQSFKFLPQAASSTTSQ
jgi:membrane-bound inhibitor of C-type lysozyme